MFYGEEYNVPPCCDQKYFRYLWEELRAVKTTTLFMQSDYSLQHVLAKVLLAVPMSHLSLMVPELSETLLDQLSAYMSRHWYHEGSSKSHMLEKLTLVAPETQITERMDLIKSLFAPYKDRVVIAKAPTSATLIHVKNAQAEYVFSGTAIQHANTRTQHLTALVASMDARFVKEHATVIRLNTHKKVKLE